DRLRRRLPLFAAEPVRGSLDAVEAAVARPAGVPCAVPLGPALDGDAPTARGARAPDRRQQARAATPARDGRSRRRCTRSLGRRAGDEPTAALPHRSGPGGIRRGEEPDAAGDPRGVPARLLGSLPPVAARAWTTARQRRACRLRR